MIPPGDIADLQAAFQANARDIGVGLYNPSTGEIRLGSFDLVTGGQGHQGLADALGITDNGSWRGFIVTSDGRFSPTSHFNLVDGGLMMKVDYQAAVRQDLQQGGLLF
jgi:hypothetical protein